MFLYKADRWERSPRLSLEGGQGIKSAVPRSQPVVTSGQTQCNMSEQQCWALPVSLLPCPPPAKPQWWLRNPFSVVQITTLGLLAKYQHSPGPSSPSILCDSPYVEGVLFILTSGITCGHLNWNIRAIWIWEGGNWWYVKWVVILLLPCETEFWITDLTVYKEPLLVHQEWQPIFSHGILHVIGLY